MIELRGVDAEYNSELQIHDQNKVQMASYSEALSRKNKNKTWLKKCI